MKKIVQGLIAVLLVAALMGTFAACKKKDAPTAGTTQPATAREWTELPEETTAAPTVVGTDTNGVTQVYEVVTDAQGQTVTKKYTVPATTKGSGNGSKTTTKKNQNTTTTKKSTVPKTTVNDDIPKPDNPGWGEGTDASKTPFELKDGYDLELIHWVNMGIGDMVDGRGLSSHMDSPKSTLGSWTWNSVRSYANTGKMDWSGIMNHVEKYKNYPEGEVFWKVSGRVAVNGFKGKTYSEAGRYIAEQVNKQTGLKSKAKYWGGDGEDFLGVYQKGGYWYVIVGCAASSSWR